MFGHHPRGCQDTKSTHRSPDAPCVQILQKSSVEEIKPSVLVHDKGTSKSWVRKPQQLKGLHRALYWHLFTQQVPARPTIYQNRVLPSLHLSSNSFQGEQPGISTSPLPVPASPNLQQFPIKLPTEGEIPSDVALSQAEQGRALPPYRN